MNEKPNHEATHVCPMGFTLHVGHLSVITSKMANRSMRKRGMADTTSAMSEMYRARSRGGMNRSSDNELKVHAQCSAGHATAHRLSRRRNTAGKTFSARYFLLVREGG